MSLSISSVSFLSQPQRSRSSLSKTALGSLDFAFLMSALVVICGGCLFTLDLASARSTGQESVILSFVSQLIHSVPSLLSELSTYFSLFLSSILTSAILVAFVSGLRALDQKVSGSRKQQASSFYTVKSAKIASLNQYKAALRGRRNNFFLISPVFQ